MKSTILKFMFITISLAIAMPVHAASALQIWECTLKEGKTPQDAEAVSSAWLKAAKGLKGGEQTDVYVTWPVAADAGGGRFNFVMVMPSFADLGAFENGYEGSAAAKADDDFGDIATCSGSSLWASVKME